MVCQVKNINGPGQCSVCQHANLFNNMRLRYKRSPTENDGSDNQQGQGNGINPFHRKPTQAPQLRPVTPAHIERL